MELEEAVVVRLFVIGMVVILLAAGVGVAQLTPIMRGKRPPVQEARREAAIKRAEQAEQREIAQDSAWQAEPLSPSTGQASGETPMSAVQEMTGAPGAEQPSTMPAEGEPAAKEGEKPPAPGPIVISETGTPPGKRVNFPATGYNRERWNREQWDFQRRWAAIEGTLGDLIRDERAWEAQQAAEQAAWSQQWARATAEERVLERRNEARWRRNAARELYLKDSPEKPSYALPVERIP